MKHFIQTSLFAISYLFRISEYSLLCTKVTGEKSVPQGTFSQVNTLEIHCVAKKAYHYGLFKDIR